MPVNEKAKTAQAASLLVEVIVLFIFAALTEAITAPALFIKKQEGKIDYRYTALDLAGEILEFGEGIEFSYGKSVAATGKNNPRKCFIINLYGEAGACPP